jgi:hypothetical protein
MKNAQLNGAVLARTGRAARICTENQPSNRQQSDQVYVASHLTKISTLKARFGLWLFDRKENRALGSLIDSR